MAKALPKRFKPDLLSRDGTLFNTVIAQSDMPRLRDILLSAEHDIHCTARFSRRKNVVVVSGNIKTTLTQECQRCLKPVDVDIDVPYELVFVDDEERAEALPDQYDPVILDEHGNIQVIDLYEDEVILHVPEVPRHSEATSCNMVKTEFGELPADVQEGKPNPFDALKDLRLH